MTKKDILVKIVQTKISLAQNLQVPCESENIFSKEIHQGSESVIPEVRGTADVGWWSLYPLRSILLVFTHDFIIIYVYGPTGSDGHEWMVPKRTLVAHQFWPFEAKGVLYAWGLVQPANGPPTRTTSG